MSAERFRNHPAQPPTTAAARLCDLVGRTLTRTYSIESEKVDEENRTIELAFSSEAEVDRYYDEVEILDHSPGAVDLTRLNSGGSLLFNHNPNDPLGVVESARIDSDRKGRAVVRFGDSARQEEFWKNVKGRILRNVSVGYRIHTYELREKRDDGRHIYVVTRWEPFEVSIVTIPADTEAGVARNLTPTPPNQPSQKRSIMNREHIIAALRAANITFDENATDADLAALLTRSISPQPAPGPKVTNESPVRTAADEMARSRTIRDMGKKFKLEELADKAVDDEKSVDEFRAIALDAMNEKRSSMAASHSGLGLSDSEVKRFSLCRLMNHLAAPTEASARREAAYELEVVEAAEKQTKGRKIRGIFVPADVLRMDAFGQRQEYGRRDIISIKTGSGYTGNAGNTVATTLLMDSFVEMLRNRTVLMKLGTTLTGLEGDIDLPKQTGATAAGWIGEDGDAPGTDVDFGLIPMTPKTVAGYTQLTRKTLKQSSLGVEGFVKRDLAGAIGEAIDKAGFYGDGTGNQPVGIAITSGIAAVNFAATLPTFGEIVDMETALGEANVNADNAAYIARASFRGHAKKTRRFTDGTDGTIWEPGNQVNGYNCEITNQVNAGHLFFGDFSEFFIGLWGGLDLLVDPFTDSRKARLNISAFQDVDFAVRRPAAFSFGKKPA